MATQFAPPPPAVVSRVLSAFDRNQIASFIEVAIGLLDAADGDPDVDTGGAEDEPLTGLAAMANAGPGCTTSDAAEPDADTQGDVSWPEWHTHHRHKIDATGAEIVVRGECGFLLDEDAEDDDPPEAVGDEEDGNGSEDDFMRHDRDDLGQPGCPISDPCDATLRESVMQSDCVRGYDDDEEPWHQPPTMTGPMPANDRGLA